MCAALAVCRGVRGIINCDYSTACRKWEGIIEGKLLISAVKYIAMEVIGYRNQAKDKIQSDRPLKESIFALLVALKYLAIFLSKYRHCTVTSWLTRLIPPLQELWRLFLLVSHILKRENKLFYLFGSLWDFDIQCICGHRNNLSSGIGNYEEQEAIIFSWLQGQY